MSLKEGSVILLVVTSLLETEVSLIVPDFKHFVYGSSCNSLFFGLILSFLCQFLGIPSSLGGASKKKEKDKKQE